MTPINDKGDKDKIKVDDMARKAWQGQWMWALEALEHNGTPNEPNDPYCGHLLKIIWDDMAYVFI